MNHSVRALLHEGCKGIYDNAHFSSVGGGCINECYRISHSGKEVFCKVNSASLYPGLLEKEKNGLALITGTGAIRVPEVVDCFELQDKQVLLLQWIRQGERTDGFWKNFGKQLAELHQTSSNRFGFVEDNYMGSVVQSNTFSIDWNEFFITSRLKPLVQQCADRNLLSPKHQQQFESLYDIIPSVFGADASPSLVHGDLWSGNFMCDEKSNPVLIDPAVYYGHRSIDLAMTTMFGGFSPAFYEAYAYHFPLPPNYRQQWQVCNLYPLLIHLLLFGKSYLPAIEETLGKVNGER